MRRVRALDSVLSVRRAAPIPARCPAGRRSGNDRRAAPEPDRAPGGRRRSVDPAARAPARRRDRIDARGGRSTAGVPASAAPRCGRDAAGAAPALAGRPRDRGRPLDGRAVMSPAAPSREPRDDEAVAHLRDEASDRRRIRRGRGRAAGRGAHAPARAAEPGVGARPDRRGGNGRLARRGARGDRGAGGWESALPPGARRFGTARRQDSSFRRA